NGLGDWDIMASGNWNGNSMSPAMPGAATLITVGGLGMIEIETSSTQDIQLYPMSSKNNNTRVAYIETAPEEAVLVTYRADIGFDSELPGSGIIVEYLDKNNGNVDENTVNKDPNNPWVKILEADGDQALVRNRDSGSPGDAFQSGDSFGHEGFKIRDNRGRLVPWQIEVQSIESDVATLRFSTLENYTDRVLTPRSPIQLIEGENAYASVFSENPCTLLVNISTDLTVPQATEVEIPSGETIIPIIRASETSDDLGLITGKIGCKDKNLEDIRIEWQKIGHRIVTKETFHVIPWNQDSTIQIPIVGNLKVEGMTIEQARTKITNLLGEQLLRPDVFLKIERTRDVRVSVLGEVQKPGLYSFNNDKSPNSTFTIVDAIQKAGGIT
ncbi:MAG: polysaccharide biosynthesis/export family protein, partial [Candidatus Thermoplasmatota archaeon]|nr:polysaccharide biosynthesis/export family protein [Candidatus Thermoplasmatota archaeon]